MMMADCNFGEANVKNRNETWNKYTTFHKIKTKGKDALKIRRNKLSLIFWSEIDAYIYRGENKILIINEKDKIYVSRY